MSTACGLAPSPSLLVLALAALRRRSDKTAACDLGIDARARRPSRTARSSARRRRTLRTSALAARDEELRTSIAARRAAAWQVVEQGARAGAARRAEARAEFGGQPTIPAWHTWFARDDFDARVQEAVSRPRPAGRAARAPLDRDDAGFAWNTTALDELPEWPEQRYLDYLAAIDTQDEANGVGGVDRVGYSPGAMATCSRATRSSTRAGIARRPDPFDAEPMRAGAAGARRSSGRARRVRVEGARAVRRGRREGQVTSRGDGDADLYVRRGAAPEPDDVRLQVQRRCERRDAARSTAAGRSTSRCSAPRRAPSTVDVEYVDRGRRAIRRASTARCRATPCS